VPVDGRTFLNSISAFDSLESHILRTRRNVIRTASIPAAPNLLHLVGAIVPTALNRAWARRFALRDAAGGGVAGRAICLLTMMLAYISALERVHPRGQNDRERKG